jgi:iron complex outermembrane receptor protein
LVLVNGRQVYSDDYGYVPWQAIPVELDEIRQIEIVKGPNSALFGFNAVSGVINIITYDPLYDKVNTVTLRGGTQSLAEGSAVITQQALGGDVGVRASAGGYMAREYWGGYVATLKPISEPERGSLSVDGKWRAASGIVFDLSASDVSTSNAGQNSAGRLGDFEIRSTSFRFDASVDTKYGVLGLDAYRNEMSTDTLSSSATYFWVDDVYVVKATDLLKINDQNTIRLGLEYRNNSMDSQVGAVPGAVGGTIGYQVWSASGMWNWQLDPKLSLTNAVRLDYLTMNRSATADADGFTNASYNGITHTEVSYNSGLVYQLTDNDTFRLTAARGVQVPSLFLLGSTSSGNPNIQPAIVGNYEADYERALPVISSTVRSAVFYQTYDDIIDRIGAPVVAVPKGAKTSLANNVGDANELGVELELKGHSTSGFRWNASYSFATVNQNLSVNNAPIATSPLMFQKGTPEHTIIGGLGYTYEKLELDGQLRWQSEYTDYVTGPTNPAILVPNFVTVSARIGYRVTDNVTLALSGAQLGKDRLMETGGPAVARRVMASATVKF